jgi:hypothetical protein
MIALDITERSAIMETNERIKWLLEATPEQLSAYDALRAEKSDEGAI